jgi:hypothetical protein
MITPQGRIEAKIESQWTLDYFNNLLPQWSKQGIIQLEICPINLKIGIIS